MRARGGGCYRCGRRRRRAALRLALLTLPALFWSAVFAALAGARPLERVLEILKSFEFRV
jgi:hypothetical protein